MDLQGVLKRVSWRVQVVVGLSAGALVFSHVFSSKRRKREFKERDRLLSLKVPRSPSRVDTFRAKKSTADRVSLNFGGDLLGPVAAPSLEDAKTFFQQTSLKAFLDGSSEASRLAIGSVTWTAR